MVGIPKSLWACMLVNVRLNGVEIMFDTKKLTEEQVGEIKGWAAAGAQLSEIQKRMEDEMKLNLTYMDTRFLILDLEITLRDLEEEARAKVAEEESKEGAEASDLNEPEELTIEDPEVLPADNTSANVSVSINKVSNPGFIVSGRVTFSDGNTGMWYVDDQGLGIQPDVLDYQPSRPDIEAFQKELERVMEGQ